MTHTRWLMVVLLVLLAIPLAAQEESGPPQVGQRPDAPTYALHGPYWVGTMELVMDDEDRPQTVSAWYPALNPDGVLGTLDYNDFNPTDFEAYMMGHALVGATPDVSGAPYPLVVYSHGNVVSRYNSPWLLEQIASQGFVVLAPDHPGDNGDEWMQMANGEMDPELFTTLQTLIYAQRPIDVAHTIALADTLTAQGGALEGLIDTEKIAVTGTSFGSYTAFLAAGARLDLPALKTWCAENPEFAAPGLVRHADGHLCADRSAGMADEADQCHWDRSLG